MKELFIPFHIPNFQSIQAELLSAIDHDYTLKTNTYAFTYQETYMLEKCPGFMAWLKPRLKLPVRLYRYYITPPKTRLSIHIDGTFTTVPFALNIPVAGTKDTQHTFYETNEDNIEINPDLLYLGSKKPIDVSRMKKLKELEILQPHVTNNSVFHGVTNNTDQHRVMFTVRWLIDDTIGRTVEECMDTQGLFDI